MSKDQEEINKESEIRYVPVEMKERYHDGVNDNFEIDIISILKRIWNGRNTIYKFIVVFLVLGLIIAYATPSKYTSSVVLLPEAQGQASNLGRLGGLAAQFGLGGTSSSNSSDVLPSQIYPEILTSTDFLHEIIFNKIYYEEIQDSITIQQYFNEFQKTNQVRNYTIGLPFQILKLFRSKPDNIVVSDYSGERYKRLSSVELGAIRGLRQSIENERNIQTGILSINVTTQSPEVSAQICVYVTETLSSYLTTYRTEKALQNLNFIEQLHAEARLKFQAEQDRLALFRDQNQGTLTASARSREQILQSEYNLAFNVYNSLSEQLEQARIKLQMDTPVISVLQETLYPSGKSDSNGLRSVFIYIILGGVIGVSFVLVFPIIRNLISVLKS